jgi:tRNA A-37 threonylcarbamoyl transferase component Bud32
MQIDSIAQAYINIITEELHPELQNVIDTHDNPKTKLLAVTAHIRGMIKAGRDTGLEDSKPKKGSSRAVFFPKEKKQFTLDGKPAESHTAVKIAFPGKLDKYHGEDTLLGEDQNRKEADWFVNGHHGVIHHTDQGMKTNHEGVLAPVFDSHPEHHHLEMGRVEKFNAKDLANHTKNRDFPKGLNLDQIKNAMLHEHALAHGGRSYQSSTDENQHQKLVEHPYVSNMIDMMHNSDMHPGDISPRNMGIYVHPHSGHRYPVMTDWGFGNDIAKKYAKARKKMNIGY